MRPHWDLLGVMLPTHDTWVGAGLLVAVAVFWVEKRRRALPDPRLWMMVAVGLGWGAIFAVAGTWLQHWRLSDNAGLVAQLAHGNRSIVGGLLGAYLGVLYAKRVTGYTARTGALFAPATAAGMAVGRVGCLLTERPGTPTGHRWGIVLDQAAAGRVGAPAGVPLHPSFAYEIAFHAIAFGLLWWGRDRLRDGADLLTLYLAAYAGFRFLVELVRGNEVVWWGMTRPQLVLLVMLPLLIWRTVSIVRAQLRPTQDTATTDGAGAARPAAPQATEVAT